MTFGTATCLKTGKPNKNGRSYLAIMIPSNVIDLEKLEPGRVVQFDITRTELFRTPRKRGIGPRSHYPPKSRMQETIDAVGSNLPNIPDKAP